MSVVDSPLEIPTRGEDRKWLLKQIFKVVAAIAITGGTVALVVSTATSNSQQKTIDRNNQATVCRSGVINGAIALLLEDPQADGLDEILRLILGSQTQTPPDYEAIGAVSQAMQDAKKEREAYILQVKQAIENCQPQE